MPQAAHIDEAVVALPADTISMVQPLRDALDDLNGIYSGEPPRDPLLRQAHTCPLEP